MAKDSTFDLNRTRLFEGLCHAAKSGRLGHALAFHGSDEQSPVFQSFVFSFLRYLLCLNPKANSPCETCASCLLMTPVSTSDTTPKTHPDAVFLEPEGVKGYSVEDMRDLIRSFQLKRSLSPHRVCWIKKSEFLSSQGAAAANSLLKLLEEPRPDSFFILTSSVVNRLLPTIKSRCQIFRIPMETDLKPLIAGWDPLHTWVQEGFRYRFEEVLPPDNEGFFEEREQAVLELLSVSESLWSAVKVQMPNWSRAQGIYALDLIKAFETLAQSIRQYAAPSLGWSELRIRFGNLPSSW